MNGLKLNAQNESLHKSSLNKYKVVDVIEKKEKLNDAISRFWWVV